MSCYSDFFQLHATFLFLFYSMKHSSIKILHILYLRQSIKSGVEILCRNMLSIKCITRGSQHTLENRHSKTRASLIYNGSAVYYEEIYHLLCDRCLLWTRIGSSLCLFLRCKCIPFPRDSGWRPALQQPSQTWAEPSRSEDNLNIQDTNVLYLCLSVCP